MSPHHGVALAFATLLAGCVPRDEAPHYALRTDFGPSYAPLPTGPRTPSRSSLPLLSRHVQRAPGPETELSRRCREILVRNEAVLAQVESAPGTCAATAIATVRNAFAQCTTAEGGGWATQLRAVQVDARATGCAATGAWRLVAIGRDGALAEEREMVAGVMVPTLRTLEFEFEREAMTRSSEVVLITSDLDSDGRPEAVVVGYSRRMEGDQERVEREIEVRTALDDRVLRYGPTAGLAIDDAQDVDEDGRVDFVLPGPYAWTLPSACNAATVHSAMTVLAHSLPDGTLSTTDEIAQRWARRWCPDRSGEPSPDADGMRTDLDRDGLRVVCRRLWGASAHQALEAVGCRHFRMPNEWPCEPGEPDAMALGPRMCPAHLRQWALADAPLRLR